MDRFALEVDICGETLMYGLGNFFYLLTIAAIFFFTSKATANEAFCEVSICFPNNKSKQDYEKINECKFKACTDEITEVPASVLKEIFPSPSKNQSRLNNIANELTVSLKNTSIAFAINSKRKLAHFLAQIKQEVGPGLRLEEGFNYSAEDLKSKFSYFMKNPKEAYLYGRTKDQRAQPESIANRLYAGKIGNGKVASGDGWRYRGRGMIQLTGRGNYQSFSAEHEEIWGATVDFVENPDLLLQEEYAVRSALVFWKRNGIGDIAKEGITHAVADKITKIINKYTNTYSKRFKNLETILKLDFFQECTT